MPDLLLINFGVKHYNLHPLMKEKAHLGKLSINN
jgi:hypothetical protein